MRKFYFLLSALLIFCISNAQIASNYNRVLLSGQTYTPITGGTVINSNAQLTPGMSTDQDDGAAVVTLPFTFTYNGNPFTEVTFCTNGWLGMGNQMSMTAAQSRAPGNLFTTTVPNNTIAPWFRDMGANFPSGGGSMVHGLVGTDVYAFEWRNAVGSGFSDGSTIVINFMVKLYGPASVKPGRIEFLYGNTAGGDISVGAAIGIEDATGGSNHFINALNGSSTSTTTSSEWPGNGNGYRFEPASACSGTPNPGNISGSATVCSGQSTTLNLTNQDAGTGITYQWLSSTGGGPFLPISGATGASYTTPALTTTTAYAVMVTCGANSATTPPHTVNVPALFPAGTYTINGTLPTGGTNFQTFAAAIDAIKCGIAGPVVFNVSPGFYDEQISIPQIGGTSATNTVTFNGNGATIQNVPVTGLRHIIQLDGADYIIFKNLNVLVQTGTTFGWGFHLTNGASNNVIDSCNINVFNITSTTQSNSGGIVVSGSGTSVTSTTAASNNAFTNNTIRGGWQGIIISGTSTTQNAGNIVSKNTIADFYSRGITITNTNNTIISENNISRAVRTSVGTFAGIELGTGNLNASVYGNRIHDTHNSASSQTGDAYGIYFNGSDATTGNENKAYNNLIYNFNSTSGVQYGIYNSSSNGSHIYHNTVVLSHAGSTGGTTRGFYQVTAASNVVFRNNIVYITRGGTGTKYAILLSTTTSTVTSNNNVLFINAPAGTNYIGGYGTNNFATLANWQTANSGAYDQQSVSLDPVFADPANGIFYPNNSAISSIGAPMGVTTDIVGTPRDVTTPTPGAYEILAATGTDVGVTELVVPLQQACYSNAETVTVKIKNYSANPINFATTPVTVNVSVTGPNATTFAPVTVNTGTLASDSTLEVVISTNYNMTAVGSYVFNASATATGDVNNLNNAMPATTRTVVALDAGTASSNPPSYCVTGGTPTLTLAGSGGGTIQWQSSPTGDPGSWVNVGTNSTSYTPAAAITATTFYRAYLTCGASGDTSNVVTVSVFTPQVTGTTPASRCGPGTVTLQASANAGSTLQWYTAATGGSPIATGTSYTTPIINTTTTYYVSAISGGTQITAGRIAPAVTDNTLFDDAGLVFSATQPFTLNSVDVYPNNATPTTFAVALVTSTGTVLATSPTITAPAGNGTTPYTVNLGFAVPTGTDHRLIIAQSVPVSGSLVREFSPFTPSYPFTIGTAGSITGGWLSGTSTTYYFFYNWKVTTGCETARTAVTATISPAPAFDVTNSTTICNNAITPLQVNSSLANFDSYVWSPTTGLYTDPAATVPYTGGSASIVFAKIGTAGVYTYVATANNATSQCQNIDSLKLTVLPAAVTVNAVPPQICVSGSTSLSFTPDEPLGAASFQWFNSADGTTFNPITNATGTNFNTPVLTSTTHYKLEIKDAAGNLCLQPTVQVVVNNPQLLTTTPDTRCGPGTLNLAATSSSGATINWYASPTGGTPIATGPSFTTPSLNATTTYYVAAMQGGSVQSLGAAGVTSFPNAGTNASFTAGMEFDVLGGSVTIQSVDIYPTSPVGTNFQIVVRTGGGAGTVIATYQGTTTVSGTVASPVVQTVPVNFTIPAGTNYTMTFFNGTLAPPLSGTAVYPGALRNNPATGATFPYTLPGFISITNGTLDGVWYYFYNWKIQTGCESARQAVTATVSPNTGILTQPVSQAVCAGATVTFTVNAEGANLTYQWRKGTTNIPGATNDTLILNNVTIGDAGTYNVVINGLCGNVTSADANLTVAADNSWLGAVSTDWNNAANWCGGVPTATSDVVINAGTPFQPTLNGIGDVRNITINNGATVTIGAGGFLNIHGHFTNNGNFNAPQGFVAFKGTANQNVNAMTAGTVIMNGTGGVTLTGNMTVTNSLVLTNGNITLGTNNLILNGSSTGSAASHVITNSTGSVISNNITASQVVVPVGPNATSYNPVLIANGQGRNYTVRVAVGINPSINNPARAVNRTWTITPSSAVPAPVDLVLQFSDADVNGSATSTVVMEVGVHNGTSWSVVSPGVGVTPSGTPNERQVGVLTTQFGPMVVGNFGAISFPTATAGVDPDVTSIQLMPNPVQSNAVLRVNLRRTMKLNWCVVDANGRIVMTFSKQMLAGQNDMDLQLSHLAAGTYHIVGSTEKGKTQMVRFVKM